MHTRSSPIPGVGIGELVPRPGSAVLGGLPLTTSDFRDFAHMVHKLLVDDVSAPV